MKINLHSKVLNNLEDGVLVLAAGGRIAAINPAAQRILDLPNIVGQTFTEVLIMREGLDDFTQVLVEATQSKSKERKTVQIQGETARTLTISTSYIRDEGRVVSVVAVFSDVTEINALRESEHSQHTALQTAFREIEDRNNELAIALRKVHFGQILGAVFAIVLFAAAGLWSSRSLFESRPEYTASTDSQPTNQLTVRESPVSTSVTLRGALAPWKTVAVRSKLNGALLELNVQPGQHVKMGTLLARIDLSLAQNTYTERRTAHRELLEELDDLMHWEASDEMAAAKRSLTKSQLSWEGVQTTIDKNRFLHGEGLLSDQDMASAEREYISQKLDFEAAQGEYVAVENNSNEETIQNVRLRVANAEKALQAAEKALSYGDVYAPIAGTVLKTEREMSIALGYEFRTGEIIMQIGDFSRIGVEVEADESDITKFSEGQSVEVTGNAFQGLQLSGHLNHVASQANPRSHSIPQFQVKAILDPTKEGTDERLRIGMSAQLRIITYDNPNAIMIPIRAVRNRGREHIVQVVTQTGEVEDRKVQIGPTTLDSVEIGKGLSSGETIQLR